MPRMVGEKSSIVPIAIGGIIIAAVAVAVWYATRGSQTEDVNGSTAPVTQMTPPGGSSATSDNATSGSEAANSADNTSSGAMGAENSAGANATGADNAMSGAGNTSPMGSAGANSAGGMNGAASNNAMGSDATSGTSPEAVPSPLTSSSSDASSAEKRTRSKTIVKPDGTKVTYSKSIGGASGSSASKQGANAVSSTR